ncbi:MAG: DNA ligase D [Gaiella sp.]
MQGKWADGDDEVKNRVSSGEETQVAGLGAYERKRNPARTPEPFGPEQPSTGQRSGGPIFVVQRHQARRLHFDFRLERGGTLASWAVPKGIPLERGARHLAVHVEDHPLEYATFEGTIPAGQYGAGTVEIWDHGTYELVEEKRDGGLTVRLHGSRLQGLWTLVPARLDGKPENWLLLRKDEDITVGRYAPMLATAADRLPAGPDWSYELKWDGFRAIATIRGGDATLTSRNDNDLSERFRPVTMALPAAVSSPYAVLDGEICALDEAGRSSFSALQQGTGMLAFIAFDLLEVDGEPLCDRPFAERRARLEGVLRPGGAVLLSPLFDEGEAMLAYAREHGLEGVVAKRRSACYQPGRRTGDWVKVKLRSTADLVVCGWTTGSGRRTASLGSLILARETSDGLVYAGNVGSGFTDDELERLLRLLRPLETTQSPLAEPVSLPRVRKRDVHWVEPRLVAEVSFGEWTSDGRLRAPVYVRLREDKAPARVGVGRSPLPAEIRRGSRTLRLSNLDKPFWPEEGITKGDLLAYYRDIAPVLVPHLKGRPFTMKRYPDGWQGKHFFQKQAPSHMPEWIRRVSIPASTRDGEKRTIDYAVLDDDLALLWAVGMGCIDLHAGAARADKLDRPDWVVFDLDPAEGTTFEQVVEVSLLVRELLRAVDLEGVPKTSGSRGIHVLVPVARRHTHEEARAFAEIVAGALARAHPALVTTEWARAKRHGVLVDVNQNGQGRTTAMGYSVRPRAGAPVSTPLQWEEVRADLDPAGFTMEAVLERVATYGDLLAPALAGGQSLKAALRAAG